MILLHVDLMYKLSNAECMTKLTYTREDVSYVCLGLLAKFLTARRVIERVNSFLDNSYLCPRHCHLYHLFEKLSINLLATCINFKYVCMN